MYHLKDRGGYSDDELRENAWVIQMSAAGLVFADNNGDSSSGFTGSMDLAERRQGRHDIVRRVWDFMETVPYYQMNPRRDLVSASCCLAIQLALSCPCLKAEPSISKDRARAFPRSLDQRPEHRRPPPLAQPRTAGLVAPDGRRCTTSRGDRRPPLAWKVCAFSPRIPLGYLDRRALSVVAPRVSRFRWMTRSWVPALRVLHLLPDASSSAGFSTGRTCASYGLFVVLVAGAACDLAAGYTGLLQPNFFLARSDRRTDRRRTHYRSHLLGEGPRVRQQVMMSGGSLGAVIAPVLMIWLANRVGWRVGFMVLGGIGVIWAAAWLAWFRPPAEVLRPRTPLGTTAADRWSVILRNPPFWACLAGAAFTIPSYLVIWTPTYSAALALPFGAALSGYLFVICQAWTAASSAGRWFAISRADRTLLPARER
jgi:hypothetical protein